MRFARATVLGVPFLCALASVILMVGTVFAMFRDPSLAMYGVIDSASPSGVLPVVLLILTFVSFLAADVLSTGFIAPGVARAVLGERLTIAKAWPLVRRRLGSLIGLFFVATLTMIVAVAIAIAPFFLLATGEPGLGVTGVIVGIILCLALVPVFFAVTMFQGLARAVIVLENVSFAAAVKRIPPLIKGRLWWSVLIVFVTSLLIGLATSVVQYAAQLVAVMGSFLAPEAALIAGIVFALIFGFLYVVTIVVTYAYMGSVYTLIYVDLRMRHEGFDIDLARAAEARAAQGR